MPFFCLFIIGHLALYWSFSSGFGVKFSQSSSQWEARADTLRNVPNPAGQVKARKPGLNTRQKHYKTNANFHYYFLRYKTIGAPKKY
jgi:hypothetical protein